MDALKKWLITTTNHHPSPSQHGCSPKSFVFQNILADKWLVRHSSIQYVPQLAATTFAFSSLFILLVYCWTLNEFDPQGQQKIKLVAFQ